MMKKFHLYIIGYVLIFVLGAALLYHKHTTSNQSIWASTLPVSFRGEYRQGEGEWKELKTDTKLSAFDGDLWLRGELDESMDAVLYFHRDHLALTIYVDEEPIYWSGYEPGDGREGLCGDMWTGWWIREEYLGRELRIHLSNPHKYGNPNAYHEFLDSLHYGAQEVLVHELNEQTRAFWIVGSIIILCSLALLGMALGYAIRSLPVAGTLWSYGMLALSVGGYILFDSKDIAFRNDSVILNTHMLMFCTMLVRYQIVDCMRRLLTGKRRWVADGVLVVLGISSIVSLLLSRIGICALIDLESYLVPLFLVVFLVLLTVGMREKMAHTNVDQILLGTNILLLVTVLLEILNGRMGWWSNGIVGKSIFVMVFFFNLLRIGRMVVVSYMATIREQELKEELSRNRVTLALSQIRTHFIFNVLTAISGMCEYDPRKADETLVRFAHYLRTNIDIMQADEPEMFTKSLEHLEDYMALQQVRFGEQIRFEKELSVTDFRIPPLILQPIVENAIKHGLRKREEGGTIWLRTEQAGGEIIITIEDDGVGFDPKEPVREGAVGLENVRFRLRHMVNGRMTIRSEQGTGTTVEIVIPVSEKNQEELK